MCSDGIKNFLSEAVSQLQKRVANKANILFFLKFSILLRNLVLYAPGMLSYDVLSTRGAATWPYSVYASNYCLQKNAQWTTVLMTTRLKKCWVRENSCTLGSKNGVTEDPIRFPPYNFAGAYSIDVRTASIKISFFCNTPLKSGKALQPKNKKVFFLL